MSSPWTGRALWLSLTLLLCATNILTLLDHDFRSKAYNVVARIAAHPGFGTLGLSAITRIVEGASPAALEKKVAERATAGLVADRRLLQTQVARLEREKASVVLERRNLQKQLRASQAAIGLHKDRISKLGNKILSRAARSVTRRLAALPGHALSVLSATVAAGSVAPDIHDACESVKELDELNQSDGLPPANRSTVCGRAVPTPEELLADAKSNWKSVYEKSAAALNAGALIIPRTPPTISFDAVRDWLSSTLNR